MLNNEQEVVPSSFSTALSYIGKVGQSVLSTIESYFFGKSREYLQNTDDFRKKLIVNSRQSRHGIHVESLGILGGNMAAVVPQSQKQLETLLNRLDQEPNSRKTHAAFKFFSGRNSFIISDVDAGATLHRKQLLGYLVPKNYVQPVINEVEKTLCDDNEFMLRETVCKLVRAVTVKVILGIDRLPDETYSIMSAYRSDIKQWSTFPMPGLFRFIPGLQKKREIYSLFSQEIMDGQFESIVSVLRKGLPIENNNLILTTLIDLIKTDYPLLNEDEFSDLLKTLSDEQIKAYYSHDSVAVLPMLLKAADNLTDALTLCLERLALDTDAIQNIREEINENQIFSDEDVNYIALVQNLSYLDAWYKESLRVDTPPIIPRYTESGIHCDSLDIPAKTTILFDLQAINKSNSFWARSNSFYPERFLPHLSNKVTEENIEKNENHKLNQFPFIPFSTGNRMCPAFKVSEYIFKTLVAYMIHNFDLKIGKRKEEDIILSVERRPLTNNNGLSLD